ncbi:hypothetical protein F4775DRAFT_572209 [Biscogniauxia sp. FL1348]|nr:hypothetical protein F4775DRAFT_572209 [Biscogniauxia sp. FL1348]
MEEGAAGTMAAERDRAILGNDTACRPQPKTTEHTDPRAQDIEGPAAADREIQGGTMAKAHHPTHPDAAPTTGSTTTPAKTPGSSSSSSSQLRIIPGPSSLSRRSWEEALSRCSRNINHWWLSHTTAFHLLAGISLALALGAVLSLLSAYVYSRSWSPAARHAHDQRDLVLFPATVRSSTSTYFDGLVGLMVAREPRG